MSEQYAGLRAEFLEFKKRRRHGQPYPAELRRRGEDAALVLRAAGATWRQIGEAIGISLDTARTWWRARSAGDLHATALVPVTVQAPPVPLFGGAPTLVSPGGYRVEGAGVEQLVVLLHALG